MLPENIFKPSLNWLLIFIPVALTLERILSDKSVPIFLSAAIAIIPIASLSVLSCLPWWAARRNWDLP